jgi:hypothetical protein
MLFATTGQLAADGRVRIESDLVALAPLALEA